MHKYAYTVLCKQSVFAKVDFSLCLIYFCHIEFAIEVNQLKKKAESAPILPTVKRVGESFVTYAVEEHDNVYSFLVSSTDLKEGSVCVRDVVNDRATAEYIKTFLAENFVSPLHVLDIFEDALAQAKSYLS